MLPCSVCDDPSSVACDTDNCGQLLHGSTCYDLPHPNGNYADKAYFNIGTSSSCVPGTIPGSGKRGVDWDMAEGGNKTV